MRPALERATELARKVRNIKNDIKCTPGNKRKKHCTTNWAGSNGLKADLEQLFHNRLRNGNSLSNLALHFMGKAYGSDDVALSRNCIFRGNDKSIQSMKFASHTTD